ncbi:hypothetical protein F383_07466 [Gossypium arboreum]|nr:hypothetical protein F383_07466 [Gossypium arboreum]
MITCMT